MATIIEASAQNADKILVRIVLEAPLGEWKALREVIGELANQSDSPRDVVELGGGTKEPFWTLIHRLGQVIGKVEAQHRSYE